MAFIFLILYLADYQHLFDNLLRENKPEEEIIPSKFKAPMQIRCICKAGAFCLGVRSQRVVKSRVFCYDLFVINAQENQ
jgi:hypothetical protein